VVVAAGVLGYATHDLQEGNVLPELSRLAFDVSSQVPPGSWYGTLLKGTFNFTPNTTVLQASCYVVYLVVVMSLFVRGGSFRRARSGAAALPAATRISAGAG